MTSALEHDILGQAAALRGFDRAPYSARLPDYLRGPYRRIILTGTGSSHYAALPGWRRMVAGGQPAWWVGSGQLLDCPELITDDSLLIATSRSGACAEVVALLELLEHTNLDCTVVGVTDVDHSPLATAADCTVAMRSGPEAAVGTKSYLNTLAAHNLLACLLLNCDTDDVGTMADVVDDVTLPSALADAAARFDHKPNPRLAFVGYQDHACTALYAGLITKKAAEIWAESYVGGESRNASLELAGPSLTAVLFGGGPAEDNTPLMRLAVDLVGAGSTVIVIGATAAPGVITVAVPPADVSAELCHGAVLAQWLAVALARAKAVSANGSGAAIAAASMNRTKLGPHHRLAIGADPAGNGT